MSYPTLPVNRLIVGGVDLTQRFGLILADGYKLTPPTPKTYVVDIPGGNGQLDLTESLLGDVVYNNRKQEFIFYVVDVADFEQVKTNVSNLLHGQEFSYQLTMDSDHTYHGRFTVADYAHSNYSSGKTGVIKLTVDADPFKYRTRQNLDINAIGGTTQNLLSGRMRVRPTITTNGALKVIYDNKLMRLSKGSWVLNDLLLTYGTNNIYFCTYDVRTLTWDDLKSDGVTWGDFKEQRLYEWYKSKGVGIYEMQSWSDIADKTWEDASDYTWGQIAHKIIAAASEIEDINVQYDWGDL